MITRRAALLGLGASVIVAPAIVRASSLMPVKVMQPILRAPKFYVMGDFDWCEIGDDWCEIGEMEGIDIIDLSENSVTYESIFSDETFNFRRRMDQQLTVKFSEPLKIGNMASPGSVRKFRAEFPDCHADINARINGYSMSATGGNCLSLQLKSAEMIILDSQT